MTRHTFFARGCLILILSTLCGLVSLYTPPANMFYIVHAEEASPVDAQNSLRANLTINVGEEAKDAQAEIEGKTLGSLLTVATSYVLILAGFIGIGMFTLASFKLFTSEGDPKKHGEAVKGMIYSGIAFLVIFLSYSVIEVASRLNLG